MWVSERNFKNILNKRNLRLIYLKYRSLERLGGREKSVQGSRLKDYSRALQIVLTNAFIDFYLLPICSLLL